MSALKPMTKKSIMDSCTKNKLYRTPHLNDVLYLHFQGYNEIDNLDEYTEVKCLWLENNAFTTIQGLDHQKRLKCLFLQNNLINKIQNLDNCKELDTLNLCHNQIRVIENIGIDVLPVLNTLSMSHNYLRTAEQLEGLRNCKFLSVLDISHNRIDDVAIVKILADIPELRVLTLTGNPVISQIPSYRKTMILECKELTYLDSRPVFPRDRACAEAWKSGGFIEEQKEHRRWCKKDRKRTRDSVNALLVLRQKHGDDVELLKSSSDEDDNPEQASKSLVPIDYGDKDNIEKNTLQAWRAIERQVLEGWPGPAEPNRADCNIDGIFENPNALEVRETPKTDLIQPDNFEKGGGDNNANSILEPVSLVEEIEVHRETLEVKPKPSVRFLEISDESDDEDQVTKPPTLLAIRQMIKSGRNLIEEVASKGTSTEELKPGTASVSTTTCGSVTTSYSSTIFPISINRSQDSIDFPVTDSSNFDPASYIEQKEIGIVEAKNLKNIENTLKMKALDQGSSNTSNNCSFSTQTTEALLQDLETSDWRSISNPPKIEDLITTSSDSSSDCDSVVEYPPFIGPENKPLNESGKSESSTSSTEDLCPQFVEVDLTNTMNEVQLDTEEEEEADETIIEPPGLTGLNVTPQEFTEKIGKWLEERDAKDEELAATCNTDFGSIVPNCDPVEKVPDTEDTKSEVWQIDVANNYQIQRFERTRRGNVSFLVPQGEDEDTVERCRNRLFLIQKLLEWQPCPGLDERSLTVNGEVVVEDLLALREERMRESNERLRSMIDRIYERRDEINARFDAITSIWGNFKNPHKLTASKEALEEIQTTNRLLQDAVSFSNEGVAGGSQELPTSSDIEKLKQKMESGELNIKGLNPEDLDDIKTSSKTPYDASDETLDMVSVQEVKGDWIEIYLLSPVPDDLSTVKIDLRNEDGRIIKAIVSLIIESCVEFNLMHAFQFYDFNIHLTGIVQKYRQRLQKFLYRYTERKYTDDCLQDWRNDRGSVEEFLDIFGDNFGVIDKIKQLIMREYSIDLDNDDEKLDHLTRIVLMCKQIYQIAKDQGTVSGKEAEESEDDDEEYNDAYSDDEE